MGESLAGLDEGPRCNEETSMSRFHIDEFGILTPPGVCSIGGGPSSGGGAPQTTTTTQTNEPYAEQKAVINPLLEEIKPVVFDKQREFFPDSTVVPFSPETEAGLGLQSNRAIFGDQNLTSARGLVGDTISGNYLDAGNPSFQNMSNRIYDDLRRQTDSQFAQGGRYGSVGHQEAQGRAFADAIAPLQYGNYEAERTRQENAVNQAFPLANQAYLDAGQLRDVGATRENLSGEKISEQIARHNFGQTSKPQQLAEAIGLAGTFNAGGQSTSTTTGPGPRTGSSFGQGAGLALQAASLAIPAPKPTGVICTECHRRGWLNGALYEADCRFGEGLRKSDPDVLEGYHLWAIPVANAMYNYTWVANVVWFLSRPIIEAMAARGGVNMFGNVTGVLMLKAALPICRWLGRLNKNRLTHAY